MLRRYLVPALLSLACVLMMTDFAHAQRRGGFGGYRGGWGGYRSGVGVNIGPGGISIGSSAYYGYGYGGYGYGGYGSGYYGSGLYGSRYYSPYYGSYYGNRYYSPGYSSGYYSPSYYDDGYNYSYPYPATDNYYSTPAQPVQPVPDGSAQIRVIVPDPNARVWFDGNLTQQTGTDRLFHTPPLNPSVSNSYRIRATWMQGGQEMTQERVVNVTPGATAVADFR